MISQNKPLFAVGFSFALMLIAAKPKPVDIPPGDITQEGLHLNGPALNDQAVEMPGHLHELSPDTIQVERLNGTEGDLSFEGGQLYLRVSE